MNKKIRSPFLIIISTLFIVLTGCEGAEEAEMKYLERAQSYYEQGNSDKTRVEIKNVLQINPKNVDARYLLALIDEEKQDWRKAYASLAFVLMEQPDHLPAKIRMAKMNLLGGEDDQAKEAINSVLQIQPENPEALTLQAILLLKDKQLDPAKLLLEQVLKISAGHYDASLLMIKAMEAEEKYPEKLAIIEQALVANPDKLTLYKIKISLLQKQGKTDQVTALYKSLIPKFPDQAMLYYKLAKTYLQDNKVQQSEQLLLQLVKQLPDEDQPKTVWVDFLNVNYGQEKAELAIQKLMQELPDNDGLRFARLALYKKDRERIIKELKLIAEDDKHGLAGIKARNALVKIYLSNNQVAEGNRLISEILEQEPHNQQALLLRAGIALVDKKYESAIADTREILKDEPGSEQANKILAEAYLQMQEIELARESLEKLIAVNPKNLLAIKKLARVLVGGKNIRGGQEMLEKALKTFKNDAEINLMLADLYARQGEWDKAEAIAGKMLKNKKTKSFWHFKRAQLYVAQQKFQLAADEYSKALAIKPGAPNAIVGLVNSNLALNNTSEAEKILEQALKNSPENFVLTALRAELHLKQKQFVAAEKMFKKVMVLRPKKATGYINLAAFYLAQKKLDKAIAVYQQGEQNSPGNPQILMQIGILNTVKGKHKLAITAYQKLLANQPGNVMAINNLSSLLAEFGDQQQVKQAYKLVAEVLKETPSPYYQDTYGWVMLKNGKVTEAIEALEKAVKKIPEVHEIRYHLGMAYLADDQKQLAKAELQQATAKGARFKAIDKAKQALSQL